MISLGIIIPAYNYAHHLGRAVSSALACGDEDIGIELIIVDDGSTDNTRELVTQLQGQVQISAKATSFHYIHQENSGPSTARNRGLEAVEAEFIIFLDADDELCSQAVKQSLLALSDKPEMDLVICGHNSVSEGKKKFIPPGNVSADTEINFRHYLLDKKIAMGNGSIIIRKRSLGSIRFPESLRSSEDIPFFATILANLRAFGIDVPLVNVNKHEDSLRHNIEYSIQVGTNIVDHIFLSGNIPDWAMKYQKAFTSQRLLSLFRSNYLAGDMAQARSLYKQAFQNQPSSILKLSYLRKYIRIIL